MTVKLVNKTKEFLKRPFDPNETMQVLTRNKFVYWSWRVTKQIVCRDKNNEIAGLLLKVNGHHHKGYVLITLNWMDVYEVTLISTHGNVVKEFKEVYFDMLAETIDESIEKIAIYG